MTKKFTRQLTSTERVYLVNAEVSPPFANQIIMEGTGVFEVDKWKKAVEVASAANPGSRLVLKGRMNFSKWVDSGKTPPVREVDGTKWDGMGPEGAPFLNTPLSPDGPSCEVLLIHSNPLRVCIRTLHAVMDGRGTVQWLYDITRALRGEPCIGFNSTLTEQQVAKSFQKKGRTPKPHAYIAPTGKASGNERGFTWRRIQMKGSNYPNGLGQIALILASEALRHSDGPVRFAIPVDMRPRMPNMLNLGNITNLIYIDITKDSTPKGIADDVKNQLEEKRDGELYWGDQLVRYMPMSLIRKSLLKEIETKNRTGLYRNSGIISNLGEIPHKIFCSQGFETTDGLGVPPCIDVIPCFCGMARNKDLDVFEIIFSIPKVLANNGRFEALIERIKNELKPGTPK